MKTVRVLIIVLLLCVAGSSLAESYQIRVAWQTRLRESYSLDSPVVAVARAGEVLQVVGRFNRWLKIERRGLTAWLADWVDHTRLDQEAPPAAEPATNAQTPSTIDNCCFVDRQCQSQREWVDGYWAYQRNECPAPSQPLASSPPAASHPVMIQGSYLFIGIINDALDALQDRAPHWYAYVTSNLRLVAEAHPERPCPHTRAAGTCCLTPYGRAPYLNHEWNVYSYVASLVHYACHSEYRAAGHPYNGYTKVNEEADCVSKDNAATDLVAWQHPPGYFGTGVGISHCDGDLTNSPHCRWVRENCEWGPNMKLLACPAAGLVSPTVEEWYYGDRR